MNAKTHIAVIQQPQSVAASNPTRPDFIAVKDLFDRYCSRKTFYRHVKAGHFTIYKLGNRSFVKADDFFGAFQPVEIVTPESLTKKQSH